MTTDVNTWLLTVTGLTPRTNYTFEVELSFQCCSSPIGPAASITAVTSAPEREFSILLQHSYFYKAPCERLKRLLYIQKQRKTSNTNCKPIVILS